MAYNDRWRREETQRHRRNIRRGRNNGRTDVLELDLLLRKEGGPARALAVEVS
jgi:hypothetical protein